MPRPAFQANFNPRNLENDIFRAVFRELSKIGEDMKVSIRKTMEEMDLRAHGDLIESVDAVMEATKDAIRLEVGPRAEHAIYVLEGTRPHWAPYEAIEDWAQVKFGVSPGETFTRQVRFWDDQRGVPVEFKATANRLASIVWGVLHKIAERGTEPRNFLADTVSRFLDEIPERLEAAMARAATTA